MSLEYNDKPDYGLVRNNLVSILSQSEDVPRPLSMFNLKPSSSNLNFMMLPPHQIVTMPSFS